jgi:uncharacterized radical SAM superfamily Fe-S cluster-containing enzyme
MRFIDAYDFDVRAIKRSCVHIIDPVSLNAIPFETMNLFYREESQRKRLAELQSHSP